MDPWAPGRKRLAPEQAAHKQLRERHRNLCEAVSQKHELRPTILPDSRLRRKYHKRGIPLPRQKPSPTRRPSLARLRETGPASETIEKPLPMTAPTLPYPAARRSPHVDHYFGTPVPDPYRWMEDLDSPELATWIAAQNTLTRQYIDAEPTRDTLTRRLTELMNFERFSPPTRHGSRYLYSHNSGLQNQSVVLWQDGLSGTPNVLLDPNTLSADGTVALSGLALTHDGALAAYALAEAGSDWIRWHVRDVASGQDLPDTVRWSKFSSAAWLHDNSGFFYAGYGLPTPPAEQDTTTSPNPEQTEHDAASLTATNHFHKVFFHALGTPQTEDTIIFDRPDDPELNVAASVTDDGRYVLFFSSKGTSPNNELSVRDLSRPDAPLFKLVSTPDAAYHPFANIGTTLFLTTTLDAPLGRVLAIDLDNPAREHWRTIIPETGNNLESVSMINDTLIASYLDRAQSLVELHSPDGHLLQRLPLPGIGTVAGFSGERTDRETFFVFTNFTTPGTIYRLDLPTRQAAVFRSPDLRFNPADFETSQVDVTSADGTTLPMFVTHRRGLPLDGQNPTLLYGYGGFGISLMPEFSASRVLWMELGGVFAQPSLRGGGEFGEGWHQAGTRQNKQRVFDDFIAAAEFLIAHRYTSPARLAINGGSNGGLLVAACELQRPDLFAAVLAQVGVMDMLRFDQFTIGWAWKPEYGSPSEDEADFGYLRRYSPLHNVKPGTRYPATLIMTADHDDRVFPAHSFKYAAEFQHAAPDGAPPILLRVEVRAGHGAGMPLSKRVELTVDQYCFLLRTFKFTPPPD